MSRRLTSLGVVTLGLCALAIMPHGAQAAPPPATVPTSKRVVTTAAPAPPPAASAPPSAPPATAPVPSAPPAPAPNSVERARQGVVVVERQGKPLALGAVLEGDGRVLSALSALGDGNFLSARYVDGTRADLKMVHSDRGSDLALLTPVLKADQAPRKAGMRAARTPSFVGLQSFVRNAQAAIGVAPAALKLSPGLLGGDGKALTSAYELSAKPALVGAPIVNGEGEVVALVARACPAASKAPCVPAPYGAPVSALKQFLQRVPTEATWLGLEAAADESSAVRGVRVVALLSPDGPAALVGVRAGKDPTQADLILAVDGVPVATPAELNAALRAHGSGDSVELLLFGLGRYRNVAIRPLPAPRQ